MPSIVRTRWSIRSAMRNRSKKVVHIVPPIWSRKETGSLLVGQYSWLVLDVSSYSGGSSNDRMLFLHRPQLLCCMETTDSSWDSTRRRSTIFRFRCLCRCLFDTNDGFLDQRKALGQPQAFQATLISSLFGTAILEIVGVGDPFKDKQFRLGKRFVWYDDSRMTLLTNHSTSSSSNCHCGTGECAHLVIDSDEKGNWVKELWRDRDNILFMHECWVDTNYIPTDILIYLNWCSVCLFSVPIVLEKRSSHNGS